MTDNGLQGQYGPSPRRRFLLRVLIVTALFAMVFTLIAGDLTNAPVRVPWYRAPAETPLQGDLLYRTGQLMQQSPSSWVAGLRVAPEELQNAGIGIYERLALKPASRNPVAMYRLAVAYASRGYPEEAVDLFGQLVTLDEAHSPFYFAASSVYDPADQSAAQLTEAIEAIDSRGDWVSRVILADLYDRLGRQEKAADIRALIAHQNRRFGIALLMVTSTYLLLSAVGLFLVARFAYYRLCTLWRPLSGTPPAAAWSPFEAVEVVALLLASMVVVSLVFDRLIRVARFETSAPWALPLIALIMYLLFTTPALVLISRRAGRGMAEAMSRVGFNRPIDWTSVGQGLAGYGVMLTLLVLAAALLRLSGLDGFLAAAQSTIEMLQSARTLPELGVYLVLLCVVAPVLEETVFRGFVYVGLRQRMGLGPAIAISAILFGVAHLSLAVGGMVAVAFIGVLLAYLYERTGVIWPSIVAHSLHNFLAFVLVVSASL